MLTTLSSLEQRSAQHSQMWLSREPIMVPQKRYVGQVDGMLEEVVCERNGRKRFLWD